MCVCVCVCALCAVVVVVLEVLTVTGKLHTGKYNSHAMCDQLFDYVSGRKDSTAVTIHPGLCMDTESSLEKLMLL